VCDYGNNRVQILSLQNHSFIKAWGNEEKKENNNDKGKLKEPHSICHHEDIIYVGNETCIQSFTYDGIWIQKIGGNSRALDEGLFNYAWGLCVVKNRLYVSDRDNKRIQVFQEKTIR